MATTLLSNLQPDQVGGDFGSQTPFRESLPRVYYSRGEVTTVWQTKKDGVTNRTTKDCLTPALPLRGLAGGNEERIGGRLEELRPDPRQQGSGRTLHAFGGH